MENHGRSTSLIDAYPIDLDDFPYRVFSRDMIGSQQEGANMKGDLIFAQYGIAQPDHNTSNCQWRLFFLLPPGSSEDPTFEAETSPGGNGGPAPRTRAARRITIWLFNIAMENHHFK